jgi:uncharacterized OB-fold protein
MTGEPLRRPQPRRDVHELPFWQHVERHALHLQRCEACATLRYPPAPICPQCLEQSHDWAPLRGTGTVLAWTVLHRQYFPELPVPYTVVAVETDEGPILVADLLAPAAHRVAVGDRVHLTYEPVAGEPDDWTIYQWTPTEESHDR